MANFYLQGSDYKKETRRSGVRFEWNMIYSCNYRCSYCFFEGKWEEYGKRNIILPPRKWGILWERLHGIYGPCEIIITGGEPFIYPDFIPVIKEISCFHSLVNISSNGTGDLAEFAREISAGKVSVTLSFHPEFSSLDDILAKQRFLESEGFASEFINFCAYPPFMHELERFTDTAEKHGSVLKVIPFVGEYRGASYPDAYSAKDRKLLGLDQAWENNVKRKGTLCAAGMKSALIFPDGKVARCGQIGEKHLIGNIFDQGFRLMDGPLSCEADMCPCLKTVSADL